MKSLKKWPRKNEVLIIGAVVFILLTFVVANAMKEVQQKGLKAIVSEIWEGESE